MKPQRIQLRRTKGWRLPADTVNVSRPTFWGNPYLVNPKRSAKEAVRAYRMGVRGRWAALAKLEGHNPVEMLTVVAYFQRIRRAIGYGELTGKDIACWCPVDQPCHGDVLLEIANRKNGESR